MAILTKTVFTFEHDYSQVIDWTEENKKEAEWLEGIQADLRAANPGEYVGEVLSWQRCDGYASYIVVTEEPVLMLSLLARGDCYTVEDALIRGLIIEDVIELVSRRKRFEAMCCTPEEKKRRLEEAGIDRD